MNKELIKKIRAAVADPAMTYDQQVYFTDWHQSAEKMGEIVWCGSPCCIAGWAVHLALPVESCQNLPGPEIEEKAREAMDISEHLACRLFSPAWSWISRFGEEMGCYTPTRADAVAVLDRIIGGHAEGAGVDFEPKYLARIFRPADGGGE